MQIKMGVHIEKANNNVVKNTIAKQIPTETSDHCLQ